MTRTRFHIVDVFAERQFAGNQLAVLEGADELSDRRMQRIAREFNFSETTFIESNDNEDSAYKVRIFTPEEEIPFAGHPTLGTAFVIRNSIADGSPPEVTLDLPIGNVPVRWKTHDNETSMWMTQPQPDFRESFQHAVVATMLGLEVTALDRDWPVQAVSTGLPTVIVPLKSESSLAEISIDREAYDEFVAGQGAKNILAFCPDPERPNNDLAVRVFAPFYGVPEDPATGSSNGCLAAYLAEHEYYGRGLVDVRVEQGVEMGRPSQLYLRADAGETDFTVEVGGQVRPVAEGDIIDAV